MKTLKLFCIILMNLMVGLSMTGCSDNDDPGSPTEKDQRIKNILYDSGITATFNYNNEGKLSKVDIDHYTYSYQWNGNNTINIGKQDNSTGQLNNYGLFTLNNGRITSFESTDKYKVTFEYNSKGLLTKAIKEPNSSHRTKSEVLTYTWENGNLTEKTVNGETNAGDKYHYSYNYTYAPDMNGTNLCYFFNGFLLSNLFPDNGEIFLIVSNPSLLGKEIANAIKEISSTENETNYDMFKTFEYDKKEYPTRVVGNVKQPDDSIRQFVYVVSWEQQAR